MLAEEVIDLINNTFQSNLSLFILVCCWLDWVFKSVKSLIYHYVACVIKCHDRIWHLRVLRMMPQLGATLTIIIRTTLEVSFMLLESSITLHLLQSYDRHIFIVQATGLKESGKKFWFSFHQSSWLVFGLPIWNWLNWLGPLMIRLRFCWPKPHLTQSI
jgi:hypothetical protein